MKVLALEFSSSQRSVAVVSSALSEGSPKLTAHPAIEKTQIHVTRLPEMLAIEIMETAAGNTMKPLGMVDEALQQAGLEREQIECVAVGLGPGSYTGVRVAIALAQGWQLARGVKLLGVSSAECIAAQAESDGLAGRCSVVIDAQREEFYLATYEIGATGLYEVEPLKLATRAEVCEREQGGVLIGPEVTRWFARGRVVFPRATTLGRLALGQENFVVGNELEPIYLRETRFVKAPPVRSF